jgi:hypothetical protein
MTRKAVSGKQPAGHYLTSNDRFISGVYRICAMLALICLGFLNPSPARTKASLPQPNSPHAAAKIVEAFGKVPLDPDADSTANTAVPAAGNVFSLLLVPVVGRRSRKQRRLLTALAVTLLLAATLGFSGCGAGSSNHNNTTNTDNGTRQEPIP